MKYLFCIVLQIFGLSLTISQDKRIDNGFTIEPFVGYSISTFIDGDIPSSAYLNTYAVGIIANYYANDTWSIRYGIIKDRMGGSLFGLRVITEQGLVTFTSEILEQEYITIPIQANWHFGKRKRWNLAFGLSYSISVGEKLEFGDQINSNFAAPAIDIAYKFPVGPGNLVIRSSSLVRVEDENDIFSGQRRSILSLGYAYNL